jgi:hypothetical protein
MADFQSSPDGALFELVARGKKDTFFFNKDPKEASLPFNQPYLPSEPFLSETRLTVPKTPTLWGRALEFEVEVFGDILREMTLKIDLPTWLPDLSLIQGQQAVNPQNVNQCCRIKQQSTDYTYGWTNGIGAFLFESIELLQDKIRILELSGDALFFLQNAESSNGQAFLRQRQLGEHGGSPTEIGRNATPGTLYLRLPWPGATSDEEPGFPLVAATDQSWRVRLKLRSLEQLLETSYVSETQVVKGDPFSKNFYYTDLNGNTITFQSKTKAALGYPTIQLLTRQSYIRDELRQQAQKARYEIPFRRFFPQTFNICEPDYAPFNFEATSAAQPIVPILRRLEAVHPAGRLLFTFRSQNAINTGRLATTFNPLTISPDGQFYNTAKLIIAGQDREDLYGPQVWQDLLSSYKDDRYPGATRRQSQFNWTACAATTKEPTGTINFSTADRPNIYIEIQDTVPDPATNQKTTQLLTCVESWDTFVISEGRAYVKFYN